MSLLPPRKKEPAVDDGDSQRRAASDEATVLRRCESATAIGVVLVLWLCVGRSIPR
jgi:hypothetical protein